MVFPENVVFVFGLVIALDPPIKRISCVTIGAFSKMFLTPVSLMVLPNLLRPLPPAKASAMAPVVPRLTSEYCPPSLNANPAFGIGNTTLYGIDVLLSMSTHENRVTKASFKSAGYFKVPIINTIIYMSHRKTLHSKFTPTNKDKYVGDWRKIHFRSSWERCVGKWCDANPNVKRWNSEEVIIPYVCPTDNKTHRYYMDFMIEFKSGKTFLIEVKPECQTQPPQPGKRKTKRFVTEAMTYAKNDAKWNAAKNFADRNGIHFEIWTEKTLNKLGIPVRGGKK